MWWTERKESHIRATAPGLSAGAPLSHLIWLTKQTQNYKKFQANNHRALNAQHEVRLHVGLHNCSDLRPIEVSSAWGLNCTFSTLLNASPKDKIVLPSAALSQDRNNVLVPFHSSRGGSSVLVWETE